MTTGEFIDAVLQQTKIAEAKAWFDELKRRRSDGWRQFRNTIVSKDQLKDIGYGISCIVAQELKSGDCDSAEERAHVLLEEIHVKANEAGAGLMLKQIDRVCELKGVMDCA